MYRNTYVEVNLKNIEENVKKIIQNKNDYKYYFGVVKANCYGHMDNKTVNAIIKGGCNYLAVATLDEALKIREYFKEIPILCLGIIPIEYINKCVDNNITITISNLEYLKKINKKYLRNIKVHIKLNTGMNRLGITSQEEFVETYNYIMQNNIYLEGIYSHIYEASNNESTTKQIERFRELTSSVNLKTIPIIHIASSDVTINYKKDDYINGCRLGIAMYGLTKSENISLKSTFKLCSEIIQINTVVNDKVGYDGAYKTTGEEKIAVIPIGYADGIIRKNTGRCVFINNRKYQIVGNICMDMLFVKVDDDVKVNDLVYLINDNEHIFEIANHLETIPYEIICSIGERVSRKYID